MRCTHSKGVRQRSQPAAGSTDSYSYVGMVEEYRMAGIFAIPAKAPDLQEQTHGGASGGGTGER
jgi:hypothetical protein